MSASPMQYTMKPINRAWIIPRHIAPLTSAVKGSKDALRRPATAQPIEYGGMRYPKFFSPLGYVLSAAKATDQDT